MEDKHFIAGGCALIDRIIRLFKILNAIQANPGISATDLAFKCEVTVRTIYRDLDVLFLIAPITNDGRGTGYRFIGNFAMYPLNFTEQEALVFSLLPSFVDREHLPPGFDSAYDKVMASHTKEQAQQRSFFDNMTDIIQMGTPAYRQDHPNFLQPIIQGLIEQRALKVKYHSQYRDETTTRTIDPYYLVPREQRFYLIGYCHLQQDIRTFRISRFLDVELTTFTFDKSDFNIKQYLKHTWSIERGDDSITFKVKFAPKIARYIKEEELFVQPWMKDLEDGSLLFEVRVNNAREFLNWVMQYGTNAEILEPQSIREQMADMLAQWRKMYQ